MQTNEPTLEEKIDELYATLQRVTQPKSKKVRIFMAVLKVYVFIFSAVGFAMFIGEEAVQTTGFSCFGYAEAQDFVGMDIVCRASYATILDWYCGLTHTPGLMLLNPLLTPSYQQYCKAGEAYLKSIETRIQFKK